MDPIEIKLSLDVPTLTAVVRYAGIIRQTQDLDLAHWWDYVAAQIAFEVLHHAMKDLPAPPAPKGKPS